MLPDTDFAKLVNAMFNDTYAWRDLDKQIRTMNKKLAQWRRARVDRGATYRLTQRAAFEVSVTMQTIYGNVEKPRIAESISQPQPAIATPLRVVGEQDGVWIDYDGSIGAAMIWRGEQIVATADDKTDDVQHVSAAA
jgi:hypothetical protein